MYGLGSAPVLGFDLARLPGGGTLAELLLVAMRLDEPALTVVAGEYDQDGDRATAWLEIAALAAARLRIRDVLAGSAEDGELVTPDRGAPDAAVAAGARRAFLASMLEHAPLGDLDRLLSCIREDVFDWTWDSRREVSVQSVDASRAITVICDAAAAAYLRPQVAADTADRLLGPWERARAALGATGDPELEQLGGETGQLLAHVAAATPAQIGKLSQATSRWRHREPMWAEAVNEASWAVSVTGRVRDTARVQLRLVLAARAASWPVSCLAGGDWNVLSGAAHALVVRDVLPAVTESRLLDPYLEVFGDPAPHNGRAAA